MKVTLTENQELNRVQLRFSAKPREQVRDGLKAAGWRWSRSSRCWYKCRSEEVLGYARTLASGQPEAIEDYGLRAMTDVDSQWERQCEEATGEIL